MKSITLKQLKDQYYPDWTGQQFAEYLGINNSLCNKLIHGKYDSSTNSKNWQYLKQFVKDNYNLQLISENKFVAFGEQSEAKIKKLQYEIDKKDRIIAEYEEIIKDLLSSVRIMVGAKESIEKGKIILHKYQRTKNN